MRDAEAGKLKPLEEAEKLVKESQTIPAGLHNFQELSDGAAAARAWVEKAQQCLKGKHLTRRGTAAPPPTLAHAERLIREAAHFIVSVRELASLTERVASAKVWSEQAEEAVGQWRQVAEHTFKELMMDHDRFGLELPAAAYVRACLDCIAWEHDARHALAGTAQPAAAADKSTPTPTPSGSAMKTSPAAAAAAGAGRVGSMSLTMSSVIPHIVDPRFSS